MCLVIMSGDLSFQLELPPYSIQPQTEEDKIYRHRQQYIDDSVCEKTLLPAWLGLISTHKCNPSCRWQTELLLSNTDDKQALDQLVNVGPNVSHILPASATPQLFVIGEHTVNTWVLLSTWEWTVNHHCFRYVSNILIAVSTMWKVTLSRMSPSFPKKL